MGYGGGGVGGSSADRWSKEQSDYLLYLYKLVAIVSRVFGQQRIYFTGSLALNAHFEQNERRIVGGVDITLLGDQWYWGERQCHYICDRINLEFERENLASDLNLNGVTIRLGSFEVLKNTGEGRLRLAALVRGGHMNLKKSCRLIPSGSSKLAYLDGDRSVSEMRVSPIFLGIMREGFAQPHENSETTELVTRSCINHPASSAGYEPITIKTPTIENLVAAKLNMIYQSSINENLIRATPLATHYAIKNGRQRVSGADVYDFVLGARQANPAGVKRALKPLLVEPVNAVLDMTALALNRIASGKYYEELNSLLPENRRLTQEAWRALCVDAVAKIRKIREA